MLRLVRWFALLTSLVAVVLLLVLPSYSGITVHQAAGGRAVQSTQAATLLGVNGFRVLFVLAIPVLAAVSALLPWPTRFRRSVDVLDAIAATVIVLLGAFSVGLFFLPTATALLVVALWPRRTLSAT